MADETLRDIVRRVRGSLRDTAPAGAFFWRSGARHFPVIHKSVTYRMFVYASHMAPDGCFVDFELPLISLN
jgi:hypothetical protein